MGRGEGGRDGAAELPGMLGREAGGRRELRSAGGAWLEVLS